VGGLLVNELNPLSSAKIISRQYVGFFYGYQIKLQIKMNGKFVRIEHLSESELESSNWVKK